MTVEQVKVARDAANTLDTVSSVARNMIIRIEQLKDKISTVLDDSDAKGSVLDSAEGESVAELLASTVTALSAAQAAAYDSAVQTETLEEIRAQSVQGGPFGF